MTEYTEQERAAYELGVEHAKNAASWTVDGNTRPEHVAFLLDLIEAGDMRTDDFLPREPNLSGEYADDPTPKSIAMDITGEDLELIDDELISALADAYEAGVSDTFRAECERILRAAVASC
jgi:hypothetical protein